MSNSKKIIAAIVCLALAMAVSFVVIPFAVDKKLAGDIGQNAKTGGGDAAVVSAGETDGGGGSDGSESSGSESDGGAGAGNAEAGGAEAEGAEAGGAEAEGAGGHSLNSLNGNEGAISLSFKSAADSLSGKLRRGDIISIFAGEKNGIVSPRELKYVYVLEGGTADAMTEADVTVLANEAQAIKLTELEMLGKLKAYLVYRGSAETGEKYLDRQREVFAAKATTGAIKEKNDGE